MTIARLSSLLCRPKHDAEAWLAVLPDELWTPELATAVNLAFDDAAQLRNQRRGLIDLMPHNTEMYERQYNEAVWAVAAKLNEVLEEMAP